MFNLHNLLIREIAIMRKIPYLNKQGKYDDRQLDEMCKHILKLDLPITFRQDVVTGAPICPNCRGGVLAEGIRDVFSKYQCECGAIFVAVSDPDQKELNHIQDRLKKLMDREDKNLELEEVKFERKNK